MNLAEHRRLRMFTFCALYCAQGMPWGFMALTLPSYLAARGLETEAIGAVLAMTTAPYAFKVVWGPIIDALPSRYGRRRPWIVFAQLMMALTVGAMIAIPNLVADVSLLVWMVFIHTVFNSMQDVAVDGLAVDLLDASERARANGLMYAAKWAGGGIGGWGMAKLVARFDLRTALATQAVVLLAIMMLPLLIAEGAQPPQRKPIAVRALVERIRRRFRWRRVFDVARTPGVQPAAACAMVMLGSTLAAGMFSAISPVLFTRHLGWSAEEWSSLAAGPGLLCGLVGSVLGGVWADRIGHRKLAMIATLCLAAAYALWAGLAPFWLNRTTVYATFWLEPLIHGVLSVSLFALCMDVCWPQIAASQFAAYMAFSNVSTTLGAKLAGFASHAWTYPGIWMIGAGLQLLPLIALRFVDVKALQRPTDPA